MLLVVNTDWQSQHLRLQPLITTPTVETVLHRFWQIRVASQHFGYCADHTHVSQVLSLHETEYFPVLWNESLLKSSDMSRRCRIIKHRLTSLCAIGGYRIFTLLVPHKFMEAKMRFTTKMDSDTHDGFSGPQLIANIKNRCMHAPRHFWLGHLYEHPCSKEKKKNRFHEQVCGN
jgi:hypothetical protein